MITPQEYEQLKSKVEKLQREANKAEGALQQLMTRLKEEFDCSTIEQAEELQAKLQKQTEKAEQEFEEAYNLFKEEWGSKLNV